jgi:hypothetical protein
MTVRNAAKAMILLADGQWHRCSVLHRHDVPASLLVEMYGKGLVEFGTYEPSNIVRLTKRGLELVDRVVTRMLIQVDKKSRVASR